MQNGGNDYANPHRKLGESSPPNQEYQVLGPQKNPQHNRYCVGGSKLGKKWWFTPLSGSQQTPRNPISRFDPRRKPILGRSLVPRTIGILLVVFTQTFRLGEAKTPGPVIGTFNPSGLSGKCGEVNQLPKPGLWGFQESHLTGAGITKFKKELKWSQSTKNFVHGAPAKPKSNAAASIGGKQTGVGFITDFPIRSIPHEWDPETYDLARCHTAAAFVQDQWITSGTVYGFADRAWTVEVQQHTNGLLDKLTSQIVDGARGPRMICGDWNLEIDQVAFVSYWESQGWVEIQKLAQQKWHVVPQVTCKHTTIKDFLFLSPELASKVIDVNVDWDLFPDHAVLSATLQDLGPPEPIPIWRKPSVIPWEQIGVLPDTENDAFQPELTIDEQYGTVFKKLEQAANRELQTKGQPGLNARQKGRAQTLEVTVVKQQTAPLRPNRNGDVQSTISNPTIMHSRWIRQLRRLQHYHRCAQTMEPSNTNLLHRIQLWTKIKRASGFSSHKGFVPWWEHQQHVLQQTPANLPEAPPQGDLAFAIFAEFQRVCQNLEESIKQERLTKAIEKRANDPMRIYHDLRPENSEPVTSLVVSRTHTLGAVTQNEPDSWTLKVDQIDKVNSTTTLEVAGSDIPIQEVLEEDIVVQTPHTFQTGATIASTTIVGNLAEMFQEFNKEWSKRWQRHENVNDERWTTIIEFAKLALPTKQMTFRPITLQQWKQALQSKKRKTASGADGVSRSDLLHMPNKLTEKLLEILHAVEQGNPWPNQAMVGIVAAIAKVPGARTVNQFRPITVLTLFYRTWATIRAKQCLRELAELTPYSLLGNIPRRSAKQLWFHVQSLVEHAHMTGGRISGALIDIVKCFNMLPREPLLQIAVHLGIPGTIIKPWANALHQVQRRFQIRGGTGPPVASSTGFPEGCPLSVVAMVITNIPCDSYMHHRFPQATVWSFVDNIETVTEDAQSAESSLEILQNFCETMDLQVDRAKSYCWSANPEERKILRTNGTPITQWARDLGGHMNYCRLTTNSTITDKIQKFIPFWSRLSRSLGTPQQKQRALIVAAWPNLFHSISIAPLGSHHYVQARSKANKALGFQKQGATPLLQLSCVSNPLCDPECWSLIETFITFRKWTTAELVAPILEAFQEGEKGVSGPCHNVLVWFNKLGWEWITVDVALDQHRIPINFLDCPIQELKQRLIEAWQLHVFDTVERSRPTMQGLRNMSAENTVSQIAALPSDKAGLLRCALNGTQYTNDALSHSKSETDRCPFCDQKDSQYHGHAECKYFETDRGDLQTHLSAVEGFEHPCAIQHGWIPQNPYKSKLKQILMTKVENRAFQFELPPSFDEDIQIMDLFTDGSALQPTNSTLRIATWGVVVWTGTHFWPISSGGVPGYHQTSLRGEIWAAISALGFISQTNHRARIWIDNQTVCRFLTECLQGMEHNLDRRKDADLWLCLINQLRNCSNLVDDVIKIKAHTNPADYEHHVDAWAALGNSKADSVASQARDHLPTDLWNVWNKAEKWENQAATLRQRLHQTIINIGLKAVTSNMTRQEIRPAGINTNAILVPDTQLAQLVQLQEADIPPHFATDEAQPLLEWLGRQLEGDIPLQWVSWQQLLVAYQMDTGRTGPRNLGRRWRSTTYRIHTDYDYPKFVMWFPHYLQNLAKSVQLEIEVKHQRPPSFVLAFWTGCIKVRMSQQKLDEIDTFYKAHALKVPARNIGKDLAAIPKAEKSRDV